MVPGFDSKPKPVVPGGISGRSSRLNFEEIEGRGTGNGALVNRECRPEKHGRGEFFRLENKVPSRITGDKRV